MSSTNCFGFQNSGSGGGGGSTGYIDIIYSDLFTAITNTTLVPGQKYRLTDYRSYNWLNGTSVAQNNPFPIEGSFNPRQIYISNFEVLLLEAISTSEISPIAYSEQYPHDIIEYLPIANAFGLENQVTVYNGATLPDSTIVSGFDLQWDGTNVYFYMPPAYPVYLGQFFYITINFSGGSYYVDEEFSVLLNGICPPSQSYGTISTSVQWTDAGSRIILNDLSYTDFLNYDINSLNVQTLWAFSPAPGRILRRNDTINNVNVPFDFRGQVFRRYEINTLVGTIYAGIGDQFDIGGTTYITTGNFQDTPVFNGFAGNIYWTAYADNNVFDYCNNSNLTDVQDSTFLGLVDSTISSTNRIFVSNCNGSEIIGSYSNLINDFNVNQVSAFYVNNIISAFNYNTTGSIFSGNTIQQLYNSKIGNGFTNNAIGSNCTDNVFGNNVANNTIKDNFSENIVGNYFQQNTINDNCTLNNFGDSFILNNLNANFRRNTISPGLGYVDFTFATYVYSNLDCQIILMDASPGNIFWLAYSKYNGGAPLIQYAAPNA